MKNADASDSAHVLSGSRISALYCGKAIIRNMQAHLIWHRGEFLSPKGLISFLQ